MNNTDFTRQTSNLDGIESRQRTIWRAIHADPPLLVGIILLCGFGLFILYSASGGAVDVVQRQALIMLGGILVMFFCVSVQSPFNTAMGADNLCYRFRSTVFGIANRSRGKWSKELVRFAGSSKFSAIRSA